MLSVFEKGEERAAADYISKFWKDATTETHVWKHHPGGVAQGLVLEEGVLDSSPIYDKMKEVQQEFAESGFQRKLAVSAVEVETGEYVQFTSDDVSYNDYTKALLSSASLPFLFPPTRWERGVFMDGGVVRETNLDAAISECLKLTDHDPSRVVLDIFDPVGTTDEMRRIKSTKDFNSVDFWLRSQQIGQQSNFRQDYTALNHKYPKVHVRSYIAQSRYYVGFQTLEGSGDYTWPLQQVGRKDAYDAIINGFTPRPTL